MDADKCIGLRSREAAELLSISERTLNDWVRNKVIPHTRIGGVVIFSADGLRDWLKKRTEQDS